MKSDYKRWENENLYLFKGYTYGWDFSKPIDGCLYTKDEAIKFTKRNKYYDDVEEFNNEVLKEAGFISFDDEGSKYLESFYKEFTTPSGEIIVAFGEYGYDG